ncbi:MAG: arylsulfatase, partial [Pirellulaceae bacterium]|nr:arylsulfatase [Pirellulaceae bacterium]
GLAFDRIALPADAPGPYLLKFSLQSRAGGQGEVYFTTDAATILPRGSHQTFDVKHDGRWHDHSLKLTSQEVMHALRLDPCDQPGLIRLRNLRLIHSNGHVLIRWPPVNQP